MAGSLSIEGAGVGSKDMIRGQDVKSDREAGRGGDSGLGELRS